MKNNELLRNYKYYKGETANPYISKDFGKAFWWTVELYAAENGDEKESATLSMTMVNYLKEKMWQGDAHPNTTLQEMLKRADVLYNHGIWSRDYICNKSFSYQQAVQYSKDN